MSNYLSQTAKKSFKFAMPCLFIMFIILNFTTLAVPQAKADLWQDVFWQGGLRQIGDTAYETTEPVALPAIIANLIRVALTFLASIFVVVVLYGGFTWMTAGGSEEKVTKARNLIINGSIGVIIIICAFAITTFVISSAIKAIQTN